MSEIREQIIQSIEAHKIIAIVRGVPLSDMPALAGALYDGGIRLLEITLNQSDPAERKATAGCIHLLRETMGDRMYFGAGTVMDKEQLALVHDAGAQFAISPNMDEGVIRQTREYGMVSIPGALTPTEIQSAHIAGADFVKVFPADAMGSAYIRAIRAPMNHVKLLAVGGVFLNTIDEFWNAGVCGFGLGNAIIDKKKVAAGDFAGVTAQAAAYTKAADALVREG